MPTRDLSNPLPLFIGTEYDWVHGNGPTNDVYVRNDTNGYLYSENHKKTSGIYREGGPFKLYRYGTRHTTSDPLRVKRGFSAGGTAYVGSFAAGPPNPGFENFSDDVIDVNSLGPLAWSRALSSLTKPDFSAMYQLLELKDVPGLLKQIATLPRDLVRARVDFGAAKLAANSFLGYQFGLKPTAGLYADYLKALSKAHRKVDQLIRDAGKPVRRSGVLFDRERRIGGSSLTSGASAAVPVLVTQCYADLGTAIEETFVRERAWYSGRFRYHLPKWVDGSRLGRSRLLRKLTRGGFSVSDAYNLVPWSWLLDYFTNAGKIAEAVSHGVEDYLYAEYFYVMYSREYVTRRTCRFTVYDSDDFTTTKEVVVSSETYCELKVRLPASRFGFGVSHDSLSATQLAILGALGISRLR